MIMKTRTNTGFKGVTHRPTRKNSYEAWVRFPNSNFKQHIGSFDTLQKAVSVRTNFITNLI